MPLPRAFSWCLALGFLGASLAACSNEESGTPPDNLAPVAEAQQMSTPEDTVLTATMQAEDPESDPLVFSIVDSPLHGTLSLTNAGTGAYTYTPSTDYFGEDGFSFRVTDGHSESAPALVTIDVAPVNDPPSATSASIGSGPYGTDATIAVTVSGWLDVENDPEGYVYAWFVNDVLVPGATTGSLGGASFSKQDSVYAVAIPFDGLDLGLPLTSNVVTITNTPPSIGGVSLGTGPFYTYSTLTAVPSGWNDADSDAESYVWRWYVNDVPVSGADGASLDGVYFARGDEVRVGAQAHDGEDSGNTVSATITIENSLPVVTAARLVPGTHLASDTVSLDLASIVGSDADTAESGDTISFAYRWRVNGAVVTNETGATLSGAFVKGDSVACEVTPSDGSDYGSPFVTNSVTIANTPPTLAGASIAAGTYFTDSSISVVPTGWTDDDSGDSAGPYRHEWYVDGVLVPGETSSTLDGAHFAKHQRVFAKVFPSDGTDEGSGVKSNEVVIENSAPTATTSGTFHGFAGLTVSGTLAGTDPDGDSLTFAKEFDGPDGIVTVTSATGAFAFVPAPGFMGTTIFSFKVMDGESASSAPASVTVVVEQPSLVGAGDDGGCAISASDHSLWCWGDNGSGAVGDGTTTLRPSPVREARAFSDWAFLDVGGDTACAIRADRSLWCWGDNVHGTAGVGTWEPVYEPTQVGTEKSWVRVSVGRAHACGIEQDESLWCWGLNSYGQVGDDTFIDSNTPQPIGSGYKEVGLGETMSCAVKTDGRLFCWGSNTYGQLGDGSGVWKKVPVQEWLHDSDWDRVFGGGSSRHTCALKTNGYLYCWGDDASGQIGYDTVGSYYGWPHLVDDPSDAGMTSWSWAAVGYASTCAVKQSGELFCWGANGHGEIGSFTLPYVGHPLQNGTEATWQAQLAMGGSDSNGASAPGNGAACGINAGAVVCWGGNVRAHLGRGTNAVTDEPVQVQPASAGFISAAGSFQHVCGMTNADVLACWGDGSAGQLGNGYLANQATPVEVTAAGSSPWAWVAVGGSHSCATQTDGTLWCWGANAQGQLGDDTTDTRTEPAQELFAATDWGTTASALSLGGEHTCAIKSSGPPHALYCWGSNTYGQLGDGSTNPRARPGPVSASGTDWSVVRAGAFHTCALDSGGNLYCWGHNTYGQLGDGSTSARNQVPAVPVAVGPWASVAPGATHTCAITAGPSPGRLFCWGWHYYGELGIGASAPNTCSGVPCAVSPRQVGSSTDWSEVFAAYNLTCAIKTSGALYCWGSDRFGQVGDGPLADSCGPSRPCRYSPAAVGSDLDWAAVYPAYYHACARKTDNSLHCWGTQEYGQAGDGEGFAVVPQEPSFP